jgi:hypothetical protein
MIVQAIALLDDLDKEINIYSMRVKEWYGWHFPELAKIIVDNQAYAKVVKEMGTTFARILVVIFYNDFIQASERMQLQPRLPQFYPKISKQQ